MDQRYKFEFERAFDVIVTNYHVRQLVYTDPINVLGSYNVVTAIEQSLQYEIDITCYLTSYIPKEFNQLMWFDMRDCGHALHFIRSNYAVHANMLELKYRTGDCDKFYRDVVDAKYRRFSKQFHEQLEDILE